MNTFNRLLNDTKTDPTVVVGIFFRNMEHHNIPKAKDNENTIETSNLKA